jgi:alpha-L-rhamnosidase
LWQNALWSQRSNFIGIPTDCPQRDERLGWMGDAHVFWDAAAYNMDVAAFTTRFMGDVEDAQRATGGYADFAPDASGGTFTRAGSSPGWADAGVILPWTVWWRYGDTGIIDAHWDSMARFMGSIQKANPDLIWSRERGSDYADWLALDAKQPGDPTTPKDLVGTAMWKAAADAMAQMAAATGRTVEADAYRALAAGLTQAFIRAFVKADGAVGNGSQTGYIQALHFGLMPTELRTAGVANLVSDIKRRGTLLSTGFLGTPYSLDVLADAGESQLVYDLLLRTSYPSWGYMIAKNATTIWERWNGDVGDKSMNSFNHYALGGVVGFLYRRIAGIDATSPGFASFRFDPVYDARLKQGTGRYQSRAGLITTRWKRAASGEFRLELQVPPNTSANVILPTNRIAAVREGSRQLLPSKSIKVQDGGAGGTVSLTVGPGRYDFRTTTS